MSKNYNHLSQEQRYQIEVLLQSGKNQKQIAGLLGVHPSSISRELARNTPKRGIGAKTYRADKAQIKTELRHILKPKRIRFCDEMKQFCRKKLDHDKYSPELISITGKAAFGDFVSHETIYKWIWYSKQSHHRNYRDDNLLYKHLKHGKRRRKRGNMKERRGIIPNRVGIEQRPDSINKRKKAGHLEVDLILGKDHKQAILIMLDRKTRRSWMSKLPNKESKTIEKAVVRKLAAYSWIKTLTFDNDLAFSRHEQIGIKLNVDTYFTRPYSSQDKGSVENRIGIVRRFIPKKTDLRLFNNQQIKSIETKLNNRPLRKFNYKSPNQKLLAEKIALIT